MEAIIEILEFYVTAKQIKKESTKQYLLFCFNFGSIPLKVKKGLFIFWIPSIYESV